MNNKNKYLLVFLFIVCILSISAISATENTTSKEITKTNSKEYNNLETINHQYDDVFPSNENELKDEENINNVKLIKDIHSNNNKKEEDEELKKNNSHNNNNKREEDEIKGSNENVELKEDKKYYNVKLIKDIHSNNNKKEEDEELKKNNSHNNNNKKEERD